MPEVAASPPTSTHVAVKTAVSKQKLRSSRREICAILESEILVGPLGFEPRTDGLKVRCSTRLS